MEGSAPDPLLFGAHARRDTPEHFVNEVSSAIMYSKRSFHSP